MSGTGKFAIVAGPIKRPETKQVGILEKGSGQSQLEKDTVKILNTRADISFPNRTDCWGVRLDDKGKVPESPLQVTDPKYKGQIQEMEWGKQGGYIITCRYLKGYNSIDMQYQDLVLGASKNIQDGTEDKMHADYLFFKSGDNFIDPETDKYLYQMLRVHYMNGSSKFRSPESESSMFEEVASLSEDAGSESLIIDAKLESLSIIAEASKSTETLGVLYEIVKSMMDSVPSERDLLRALKLNADRDPAIFRQQILDHQTRFSEMIEMAKAYDALDISADGMIAAGLGPKKDLIAVDVPGKKEEMIKWCFENYTDKRSYDVFEGLKKITSKL